MRRLLGFITILLTLLTGCAARTEAPVKTLPPATAQERAAMENVAAMIATVFGETVGTERMTFDDWSGNIDGVYVDGEERRAFEAYTAADTGEALHVKKRYDDISKVLSPADWCKARRYARQTARLDAGKRSDAEAIAQIGAEMDASCTAAACALVERAFAGNRRITETFVNSICSETGKPTQTVNIMVRMNEGACYSVTLLWPQMRVFAFSAYPLGWDACLHDVYGPVETN